VLDSTHAVYRHTASYNGGTGGWDQVTGTNVLTLASDGAYVYVLDSTHAVYRHSASYYGGLGGWDQVSGNNIQALASDGAYVYMLDSTHNVSRWSGSGWQVVRSNVAVLVSTSSGYVYALGANDQTLYRWDWANWQAYATGVQSLNSDPLDGAYWTDLAGVKHRLP
jgi:hypothetical protein